VNVPLDASMAGSAAADPLLLATSCLSVGCMDGFALSFVWLVEAEADDCASCSMTRSCRAN